MGAYLSEPVKEKHSLNEENELLQVGASSMQGWRISQEDAHNVILQLDENTSYFAVYDGHGGAEVAKYCSEKLPEFLKNLQSFKDGKYEEALKEAFLKFDATLLESDVIEELKKIAGERNPAGEESEILDEEEEDLDELCQESNLPLEKVLAKYKAKKMGGSAVETIKNEEVGAGSSGTSKPLSPRLRCKRNEDKSSDDIQAGPSSSESPVPGTSGVSRSKLKDYEFNEIGQVSSSETKITTLKTGVEEENENKTNEAASTSGESLNGEAEPSKTSKNLLEEDAILHALKSGKIQNGDIKTNVIVSSSSSNGSDTKGEEKKLMLSDNSDEDMSEYEADLEEEEDSDETEEDEELGEEEEMEYCSDEVEEFRYDGRFTENMVEEPGKDSGCTAVVALLHGRDLYVANAGDSRCVVCRSGKAIDMSIDHKPEDEEETNRITKAGGHVTPDGRVNGGLNLSRAIGDHAYKMNEKLPPEEQMISALPDVKKLIIEPKDEFMILACDGIWNYMSSEEVVELVKDFLDENFKEMSQICEELLDTCLAPNTIGDGTGCDNMTAIIIRFKKKIFEQQTKLNPNETIINEEKKIVNDTERKSSPEIANRIKENKPKTKKRAASPSRDKNPVLTSIITTTDAESTSEQQSPKRFKSGDETDATCSSSTNITTSEAVAKTQDKDEVTQSENENIRESQKNIDADADEAEAAAASIISTTTNDA